MKARHERYHYLICNYEKADVINSKKYINLKFNFDMYKLHIRPDRYTNHVAKKRYTKPFLDSRFKNRKWAMANKHKLHVVRLNLKNKKHYTLKHVRSEHEYRKYIFA